MRYRISLLLVTAFFVMMNVLLWRSEFGGFLGLRPDDFIGVEGISERDMADYSLLPGTGNLEAHFLGQYLQWDSRANVEFAVAHGMESILPTPANWLAGENMDNAQTGVHDWFMYQKFGFGRGCQQISAEVRAGRVAREDAMVWLDTYDLWPPFEYAGVAIEAVLDRIDMNAERFRELGARFTDKAVHS